jgi:hypothetical protein
MARKPSPPRGPARKRGGRRTVSGASKRSAEPVRIGKSGKPLSPAYAKRLASAEARGAKNTQEARGHRQQPGQKREHIRRRERELAEGETTSQRQAIRKFARRQAELAEDAGFDADEDALYENLRRKIKSKGWAEFSRLRDELNQLARKKRERGQYRKGNKPPSPAAIKRGEIERRRNKASQKRLSREFGIPVKYLNYGRKPRGRR